MWGQHAPQRDDVAPVENDDVDVTPDPTILPVSGADRNDGYAVNEPYLASGEADFPQQPMLSRSGNPACGVRRTFYHPPAWAGAPQGRLDAKLKATGSGACRQFFNNNPTAHGFSNAAYIGKPARAGCISPLCRRGKPSLGFRIKFPSKPFSPQAIALRPEKLTIHGRIKLDWISFPNGLHDFRTKKREIRRR